MCPVDFWFYDALCHSIDNTLNNRIFREKSVCELYARAFQWEEIVVDIFPEIVNVFHYFSIQVKNILLSLFINQPQNFFSKFSSEKF